MKASSVMTNVFLLFLASVVSVNAQSKDRDNPTKLISTEISGTIDSDSMGDNYHYAFVAGPGEMTITLSAEAGKGLNVQQVAFDLFNEDAHQLGSGFVTASGGRTEQIVKHITVNRRQRVLLRIILQSSIGGLGRYRLRLGGNIEVAKNVSTNDAGSSDQVSETYKEKLNCLPKKGTLIVRMKDGSKRIIDLSEAETVTIVP